MRSTAQKELDLAEQEGNSPRKMAGRQAALTSTNQELTIRDLESPGGTFVNQQRLLAGQTRRLVPGDVIQLGSVQVRVAQASQPVVAAPAAAPARAPVVPARKAACAAQTVCTIFAGDPGPARVAVHAGRRLTVSELGRLPGRRRTELAGATRRIDFGPAGGASPPDRPWRAGSPGRQFSLARRPARRLAGALPAAGSSAPELDVHPETLVVRASSGGGLTRHVLRINNVGYRLLRCTARVEPPATSWLRLRPEHTRPFATIDESDLPVEVELPEQIDRALAAQVVIDSNGGTRRIEVRIERPADPVVIAEAFGASSPSPSLWREDLGRTVGRMRPGVAHRLGRGAAAGVRVLAALVSGLGRQFRAAAVVAGRRAGGRRRDRRARAGAATRRLA